ncbi:MAG TPA: alpha/beta hydrolase [Pseudonocardia sp.]|nr:alpha/beta hydrolase [Pseudonocardia sp.]
MTITGELGAGVHPVTALLTGVADLCGRANALPGALFGRPSPPAVVRSTWYGEGPVVLVGGFGTTDYGLQPMRRWLERLGYDVTVHTTGIGTGCGGRSVEAVRRVIDRADDGDGVRVVAHSRGGQFARAATVAGAPVRALVTLGSPFDLFRMSAPVFAAATLVGAAGSLGLPGLATLACLRGPCCREFRDALRAPVPVPFTSVYTRGDRVVPWSASVDDGATNVEVTGGHLALLDRPDSLSAVATGLAAP